MTVEDSLKIQLTHPEAAIRSYGDCIDELHVLGTDRVSVVAGTFPAACEYDNFPAVDATQLNILTEPPNTFRYTNGSGWMEKISPRKDSHFINPAGSRGSVRSLGANKDIEIGLPLPFCRRVLEEAEIDVSPDFAALETEFGHDAFLAEAVKRLARIALRRSPAYALQAGHLSHLLVLHLGTLCLRGKRAAVMTPPLSFRQLRRLREFVESDLSRTITILDLAGHLTISSSHLSRAFKAATGQTPHDWLLQIRLEQAIRSLQQRNRPRADEVATRCGFANRRHLARCLRARYGMGIQAIARPAEHD